MLSKGDISKQILVGAETREREQQARHKIVMKKFFKSAYFLAKKNWAVKQNFADLIDFLKDIGDPDIVYHLNNAPKNAKYTSTTIVEQIIKIISDDLEDKTLVDLAASVEFTLLADESTDEADRSQLAIFARYIDPSTYAPIESYLGVVKLSTSKTADALFLMIENFLQQKHLDIEKMMFSGLDGTNAMSGERKGLQRRLRHASPFNVYLNCRNHRLALCLVHLIKKYEVLESLDKLLISTWKLFKYSSIKQAIFENAQMLHDVTPLKIMKACTTRWLTHGETCNRIISRFEPLIDALDTIFTERKDPESKGVRDLWLGKEMILTMLLLAEVLTPINSLCRYLQTKNLNFLSVDAKFEKLFNTLMTMKSNLAQHNAVDSPLKFFSCATNFLKVSSQRMELAKDMRSRMPVNHRDINDDISNYLINIGYPFVDDVIAEITGVVKENNPILVEFDAFNPESTSSQLRKHQLQKLMDVYGNECIDTYENHSNIAAPIVSIPDSNAEMDGFLGEFDTVDIALKEEVKQLALRKLKAGTLTRDNMQLFIYENNPDAANVYQRMCVEGALLRYPNLMRVFRLALLIPPSTSNVERGFSAMNLLCSPLRTSLNQHNLDRFMRISLTGPAPALLKDSDYERYFEKFQSQPRRNTVS